MEGRARIGEQQNSHTANDVRPHYLTFLLRNGLEHDFSFRRPTDRWPLAGEECACEAISNNTRLSGVTFSARLFLLTFHEFAFIAERERRPLSPSLSPEAAKPLMSLEHYGGNGRGERGSAGNKYPFLPACALAMPGSGRSRRR